MHSEKQLTSTRRKKRSLRVRKSLRGTRIKPRMCVFKSNLHLSAQLIDDETGATLANASTLQKEAKGTEFCKKNKASASKIGADIAKKAKDLDIQSVIFDRGPYRYHGLVAAIADAARENGLKL